MKTESKFQITGIGSLPFHNVDRALEYSFAHSLPFLPELPARYKEEGMIFHTLDGFPGLRLGQGGHPEIELEVWKKSSESFGDTLDQALQSKSIAFEPSSDSLHAYSPFMWELQEREVTAAKFQITGPLTCLWSLRTCDGAPVSKQSVLSSHIFKLILARSLALVRQVTALGVQPVFFIDEPGLYVFLRRNPEHLLRIQELKGMVLALKNEGAKVGVHCCSDTDWISVLSLEIDYLSVDTHLSLLNVLSQIDAVGAHLKRGGRFAFGVIPTGKIGQVYPALDAEDLLSTFLTKVEAGLRKQLDFSPQLLKQVLSESLYTPACGLALHTPDTAQEILGLLKHVVESCKSKFL